MATLYGTNYTKRTTEPVTQVEGTQWNGKLAVYADTVTLASAAVNDVVMMGIIPAGVVIYPFGKVANAALGASTTIKVGLFDKDGIAIDDDALLAAKASSSAGITNLDAVAGRAYKTTQETHVGVTIGGATATGQVDTYVVVSKA